MKKAYPHQNFDQWRWRCCFRDAYKFAKAITPHSIVKKENLLRIVDHYDRQQPKPKVLNPQPNELLHGNNTKIFADH